MIIGSLQGILPGKLSKNVKSYHFYKMNTKKTKKKLHFRLKNNYLLFSHIFMLVLLNRISKFPFIGVIIYLKELEKEPNPCSSPYWTCSWMTKTGRKLLT